MALVATSDPRDLSIFFEVLKLEHFTDTFVEKGYTIDNLHLLTDSDLDKLRITNKRERACLIGAVNMLKDENTSLSAVDRAERRRARAAKVRSFSRTVGPQERRAAARKRQQQEAQENGKTPDPAGVVMRMTDDGSVVMDVAGGDVEEMPGFTATVSTANEHARQATIFLAHQRADRAWPRAGSKLSQSLHLSGAAPVSYDPLYRINVDGTRETVCPPHKHSQGMSAKFCQTCADFVSEAMQGAWQYQVIEQVLIGEGLYEEIPVWKPFNQAESMKIEYAHKRRQPSVKIGKAIVDFDASAWGSKPIRRVETDAVPFPTLKRKDLTPVPTKNLEPQAALKQSIDELQRKLVSETEERRSRLFIEQLEQRFLVQVLADIAAMMDAYHYQQRLDLEDEETIARAKFEGDEFERALDKLYEWEEQSVRDVALRKWERESEKVMASQYACIEEMETVARQDIEGEEHAFRANLDKLMHLFNEQVREFFDQKRRKELRSRRNQDGKPRCPVCRKFDCDFFLHPWKGRWKHHGGALDMEAPNKSAAETLSTLVNRANEREYDEFLLNKKAERRDRKSKRRLQEFLCSASDRPPVEGRIEGRMTTPSPVRRTSNGGGPLSPEPYDNHGRPPSIDRSTINVTLASADDGSATSPVDAASSRPQTAELFRGMQDATPPPATRPQSALARTRDRSQSAQSKVHGSNVFRSAVGSGRHITADSINALTKQSRLHVVRALTTSISRGGGQ